MVKNTFANTVNKRAFPEALEVKLHDVLEKPVTFKDVVTKKMKFGTVAITLFNFDVDTEVVDRTSGELIKIDTKTDCTCICGGEVVIDKLLTAQAAKLFPISGTITFVDGVYYDII